MAGLFKTSLMMIEFKNKILQSLILISVFLFTGIAVATAQTASEQIINQQDKIILNNQAIIEGDVRKEEINKAEVEKPVFEYEYEQEDLSIPAAKCAVINKIKLFGITLLTNKEQQDLLKSYLHTCLNNNSISNLANDIVNYYQEKGYIAAKVLPKNKKIKNGLLELQVYEGVIEEIIINENSKLNKRQAMMAFGNLRGKILSEQDVNQGLNQINQLSSNNAKMTIIPGSSEDKVKIMIINEVKHPLHLVLTYDNLGRKSVGTRRAGASIVYDNLLSLNDKINLRYIDSGGIDKNSKDNRLFNGGVSVPYGYYTYSMSYTEVNFLNANAGINTEQKSTGFSNNKNIGISRFLMNNKKTKITADGSLTVKRAASYLDYDKVNNSERRLSVAGIGFSSTSNFKDDVTLIVKPSYLRGLTVLNAKKDEDNISHSAPHAQFQAYKIYAYTSKKFNAPIVEFPLLFSVEFDSQLARDSLYGTEKLLVGGRDSVRGFKENNISGDSGYNIRNKLTADLGSMILPHIKSDEIANSLSWLNKTKLAPFYDYGYVSNYGGLGSGYLSGAGIRGEFNNKQYSIVLTYAWGLHRSALVSSNVIENKMFYLEAGINFDLL